MGGCDLNVTLYLGRGSESFSYNGLKWMKIDNGAAQLIFLDEEGGGGAVLV